MKFPWYMLLICSFFTTQTHCMEQQQLDIISTFEPNSKHLILYKLDLLALSRYGRTCKTKDNKTFCVSDFLLANPTFTWNLNPYDDIMALHHYARADWNLTVQEIEATVYRFEESQNKKIFDLMVSDHVNPENKKVRNIILKATLPIPHTNKHNGFDYSRTLEIADRQSHLFYPHILMNNPAFGLLSKDKVGVLQSQPIFTFDGDHIDIKIMLKVCSVLHRKDGDFNTIFHTACIEGKLEIIELLLQKKIINDASDIIPLVTTNKNIRQTIDINEPNCYGYTPLHLALYSKNSSVDLIKLLLHHGADINTPTTGTKSTPLHIACRKARIELISLLLKNGANINNMNYEDQKPIDVVPDCPDYQKIIRLLTKNSHSIFAFFNNNKNFFKPTFLKPAFLIFTGALIAYCLLCKPR